MTGAFEVGKREGWEAAARTLCQSRTAEALKNELLLEMLRSEILREMIDKGQIKLVGGMYDLSTGEVRFFNK